MKKVRCAPKVANNCSTINDRFGAVVAVSETQDEFRFGPEADISMAPKTTVLGFIAADKS
jgi:hypothetical protein